MIHNRKTLRFLESIVKRTVRGYLNLNNGEVLTGFDGPVHFIRRSNDEIMNLSKSALVHISWLLYEFITNPLRR